MNKIMELAIGYASDYANGGGDKSALQAEVTRLEAEELKLHASLAESVLHAQAGWARYENANNLVKGYQTELAGLWAKLAALEAQEPVSWMRQWSFNGDETGFELYEIYGDCQKDAVYHGGICAPLYLAAGQRDMLERCVETLEKAGYLAYSDIDNIKELLNEPNKQ